MEQFNTTIHSATRRLILRDELALYRTHLANERTLMAYMRSGIALIIAGATIMHFVDQGWFWLIGLLCIPGGVVVSTIGISRYREMKISITKKAQRYARPSTGSESNT